MVKSLSIFKLFAKEQNGNIALLFALTLSPMLGAAGLALDFSRSSNLKTELQSEVDLAALSIARYGIEVQTGANAATQSSAAKQALIDAKAAQILSQTSTQIASKYASNASYSNFQLTGNWMGSAKNEYRIAATADVKNTLSRMMPGTGASTSILSEAAAMMVVTKQTVTKNPQMRFPGFEAGDYNRIYAYCYDKTKKTNADKGRSKMSLISSNGDGCFNGYCGPENNNITPVMPVCEGDETLSFRLYNVRGARTSPSKWPENGAAAERYNHYSDTDLDVTGVATFNFTGAAFGYNAAIPMMESEVCDTMAQCTPGDPASIIQTGKNRVASVTKKACAPGKFMYIGWEDRPVLPAPYTQWTDGDYDDIRVVYECPSVTYNYTSKIRLSK
jgi:Flp pilus assembly protein TadG